MSGTIASWEQDRFRRETEDELDSVETTDEPEDEDETPFHNEPIVLKDRHYGGLHVTLVWDSFLDVVGITLQEGDDGRVLSALVPSEKANDAFDHPYCYLVVPPSLAERTADYSLQD